MADQKRKYYWRAPAAKLPVRNHRTEENLGTLRPGDSIELSEADIEDCNLQYYRDRGWLNPEAGGPVRRSRHTEEKTREG